MTHIMAEAKGRNQYFLSEHISFIMDQQRDKERLGCVWTDADGREFILQTGRPDSMTDMQMNATNPKRKDDDPVLLIEVVDGKRNVMWRPTTNAEIQDMYEEAMEFKQECQRAAFEAAEAARGGDRMADFSEKWRARGHR